MFYKKNFSNYFIPTVFKKTFYGERSYDIFSRLLSERIIFINGPIISSNADLIVAQIIFLESQNPNKDIFLYINSPGGEVSAGMSIYDTIQFVSSDVSTICIGQAASMGAFILASGSKNKRFCLPNSRIMIHQPIGGYYGKASDVAIYSKELLFIKKNINLLLSKHTGKSIKDIQKDTERDCFFSAQESVDYGIVDSILYRRKKNIF